MSAAGAEAPFAGPRRRLPQPPPRPYPRRQPCVDPPGFPTDPTGPVRDPDPPDARDGDPPLPKPRSLPQTPRDLAPPLRESVC